MGEGADHDRRRVRRRPSASAPRALPNRIHGRRSGNRWSQTTSSMRRALAQGDTARRRTAPEPVGRLRRRPRRRDRRRGRDRAAGRPPRRDRGAARTPATGARGATAYATLEPCSHHGRTGPCADALLEAGVARVVVARRGPRPAGRRARASPGCATPASTSTSASAPTPRTPPLAPYLAPPPHGPRRSSWSRPRRASTAASPPPTARRSGSPAPRPGPTPTSCAPTRRRSSSAPAPRSPTGPTPHRARRRRRPSSASRCASCSTPRGRVPADGPLFDADARADARDHHRRRARRPPSTRGAAAGAKVEVVPPAADGAGVDLDAALARARRRRRAPGAGRRRRRRSLGVARRRPGSPTGSSPTSRPTCSARDGAPALALAGPDDASPTRPAGGCVDVTPARRPTSASTTSLAAGRGAALMFTGIVEELGHVRADHPERGRRAASRSTPKRVLDDAEIGDSIAVNGCCLTVVELGDDWWAADAVTETLDRTTLGDLARRRPGEPRTAGAPRRPARRPPRAGPRRRRRHGRAAARRSPTARRAMTLRRARRRRCATSSRRARSPSTASASPSPPLDARRRSTSR